MKQVEALNTGILLEIDRCQASGESRLGQKIKWNLHNKATLIELPFSSKKFVANPFPTAKTLGQLRQKNGSVRQPRCAARTFPSPEELEALALWPYVKSLYL